MDFKKFAANALEKSARTESAPYKRARVDDAGTIPLVTSPAGTGGIDGDGSSLNGGPNFLIIGAQKAGTMAAIKNLNKHPKVHVLPKEIHYFDLGWNSKTPAYYRGLFQNLPPGKTIAGEKTPELIYVDACAERIKQVCPHAKFILFLRNPVARAYSAWNMNTSKARESLSFEECVDRNMNDLNEVRSYGTAEFHYVQRGFYLDQIERFLSVFPNKENLLIVVAERMKSNPAEEYDRMFKFLGVDSIPNFEAELDHVGTYSDTIHPKVAARLVKVFAPHNERLFKFLGYRIPEWESSYTTITTKPGVGAHTHSKSSGSGGGGGNSGSATGSSSAEPETETQPSLAKAVSTSDSASVSVVCSSIINTLGGDFATMGTKAGTDKITHHGYHRYYPRFIEQYRARTGGAMLEIGIDQSCSLNMWMDYFPHAFIYGVDINLAYKGKRHQVFQVDQSNIKEVQNLVNKTLLKQQPARPVFFIIDDGSHIPEHQVLCFDYLFSALLEDGGTYIIEDIETSYWTRNGLYGYTTKYGYHHERSIIEIFKDVLDDINREFLTEDNRARQEERIGPDISLKTRLLISSITFGQNCVVISKKTEEEMRAYPVDRPYRFRRNL